jgi:ubiquinone/menaquinone biosynthesis methyltransferase
MIAHPTPTPDDIQAIFDRIAPVYDRLNHTLSLGQHRIWKLMTVKWSNPPAGGIGLDLCCGSGDLTQMLARQLGSKGQAIGLDFSQEQLAIAGQRSTHQAHQKIIWQLGDALNLPFAAHTFDCATMGYGLRNVVDIPRCLQELHRVLKPGAKAAILDFHRPSQPWLQAFQSWYLQAVVVPTAQNLGLKDEYAYIAPSLDRFPTGEQQVKLARQAAFTQAIHYPIANDMMGVLVLKKN